MTYAKQHIYVTFGGTLSTSAAEEWQCGIRFTTPGAAAAPVEAQLPDTDELHAIYDDVVVAYWSSIADRVSSNAKLSWTKAALINQAGDYVAAPTLWEGTQQSGASTASAYIVPQSALVIGLWSGSKFGRANFGRYYLPMPAVSLASTSLAMSGTDQGMFRDTAKTFVNALTAKLRVAGAAPSLVPVIMGATEFKPATSIRVGDIVDSQRRRRNHLVETQSVVAL